MLRLRKYFSFFLLLIGTLFIVPKELVHELCSHDDTADHRHSWFDGTAVDAEHHHCEILQLFVPAHSPSQLLVEFTAAVFGTPLSSFHLENISFVADETDAIRGPPLFS